MADELELELDYDEYNEEEEEQQEQELLESLGQTEGTVGPQSRDSPGSSRDDDDDDDDDREYRRGEGHRTKNVDDVNGYGPGSTRRHGSMQPSRREPYQYKNTNSRHESRRHSHHRHSHHHHQKSGPPPRPPPPPPPSVPPPPVLPQPDFQLPSMYHPDMVMSTMLMEQQMMDGWGNTYMGGRRGRESFSYKRERDAGNKEGKEEHGMSEEEVKKRKLEAIRAKREEQAAMNRQLAEERKATIDKLNASHMAKMEAKKKHLESLQEKRDRLRLVLAERKKEALKIQKPSEK